MVQPLVRLAALILSNLQYHKKVSAADITYKKLNSIQRKARQEFMRQKRVLMCLKTTTFPIDAPGFTALWSSRSISMRVPAE